MLKVICKFKNVPIGWKYKTQSEKSEWILKTNEEQIPNPEQQVISTPK